MRVALFLFLFPLLVLAQPFPTRAITIVVPFPPGRLGLTVVADSPEEFARFVAAESGRMRKLVEVSGARAD
jgi:hypothetical protein